jgi:hypothetical protein
MVGGSPYLAFSNGRRRAECKEKVSEPFLIGARRKGTVGNGRSQVMA